MVEPFTGAVGVPCHSKGDEGRKCPWWSAEQQCDGAAVAERRGERWEVRVERKRDDHARERESEPPDLPVCDGHYETMEATTALCFAFVADADIFHHTQFGKLHFERGEPSVGCCGEVGKDENRAYSGEDSKGALDEEQPPACRT